MQPAHSYDIAANSLRFGSISLGGLLLIALSFYFGLLDGSALTLILALAVLILGPTGLIMGLVALLAHKGSPKVAAAGTLVSGLAVVVIVIFALYLTGFANAYGASGSTDSQPSHLKFQVRQLN